MPYRCRPFVQEKKQDGGVARWAYVTWRCEGLTDNIIQSVHCSKACVNPINCKRNPNLKAKRILQERTVTNENTLEKIHIELPVACVCVLIEQSNRNCSFPNIG